MPLGHCSYVDHAGLTEPCESKIRIRLDFDFHDDVCGISLDIDREVWAMLVEIECLINFIKDFVSIFTKKPCFNKHSRESRVCKYAYSFDYMDFLTLNCINSEGLFVLHRQLWYIFKLYFSDC